MKKLNFLIIVSLVSTFSSLSAMNYPGDSIVAMHTTVLPIIDGDGTDAAWNAASWVDINYMWMPYGATIPAADFTGRYKVLWNKTTNLLYFLVEITDDKFVNGYVYSKSDGTYYAYDVVEVFIDEDRPGGDHAMNNNAFAYHITGGNATTDYDAIDIFDPTNSYNWGAGIYVNNKSHFPEFKRTNVGTKYTWEFSLKVLTSNYTPTDNSDLFKATLMAGKKMGLTVAYCDNDNSAVNPKRDNFIASKYETQANSDISWQNSTTFAHLTLKDNTPNSIQTMEDLTAKVWVDASKQLHCNLDQTWKTPTLQLVDITGRIILDENISNTLIDISRCKSGFYIVLLKENNREITRKIII